MDIGLAKAAARCAYYVAFHAAEALLIKRTGRIAKTHSGLRTALAQILKHRSGADRALLTVLARAYEFLARAYEFKELSDYAVGGVAVITDSDAAEMIEEAARFLARVTAMLGEAGESGDDTAAKLS